ncbi:MAG: ribonucleotide-diphosphate reductase subunit alpha [Firmicutes bacterium ADurb.Bin356]|nr:MAG: ribonucleotide-diphosphate reductase subunit alpha [Firmicutes bacterium ADurb.Bin356]
MLTVGAKTEKPQEQDQQEHKITPRPRPEVTRGITEKIVIGCGNLYVTVNYDDKGICEVFTNLGRAGGCPSQSEATSRLVSTALRSGLAAEAIIEQLKGIRCHSTLRQRATNKNIKVLSCPDAIGRVLEKVANLCKEGEQIRLNQAQEGTLSGIINCENCESEPLNEAEKAASEGFTPEFIATLPCPDCGSAMEHEGGCVVCRSCGYSKCG